MSNNLKSEKGNSPTDAPEEVSFSHLFRKGQPLGEGAFEAVYRVTDATTKQEYAAKVMLASALAARELELLKQQTLPNVVAFVASFVEEDSLVLVLELMDTDLLHYLHTKGHSTGDDFAWILYQVSAGLHHCHQQGIIHQDVKPGNILVRGRRFCLADFGMAVQLTAKRPHVRGIEGTVPYMAPVILRHERYGTTVDVWSMGIVGLYIAIGASSFDYPTGHTEEGMRRIEGLQEDYNGVEFSQLPTQIIEYLRGMLRICPRERSTAGECRRIATWGAPSSSGSQRKAGNSVEHKKADELGSVKKGKKEIIELSQSIAEALRKRPQRQEWTTRLYGRMVALRPPGIPSGKRIRRKLRFPDGSKKLWWLPAK
ncbi:hypothetical protein WA026_004264 [Henosepilachna vigintioctopunctata]|uniref:Protein kinase domain-containing protein n=1 Tax=Henosepilachna vigintioctopunctata TaxID=420089 RepID=A0AAW1VAB9_9CUCU